LIALPQSSGRAAYGFFIVGKEDTHYGKQVWYVTKNSKAKIFEVDEGYIVANSRYNVVNYSNNLIALHIRYLEPSSPEFEFYYDGIVIIDATGKVVGSFMFRDLAKLMCDWIMEHMKHWKYFRLYFGVMNQAILTEKRYIMSFPDTSPRGIQLINISVPGGTIVDIHPEYRPASKIPAGIYSYNFFADTGEQAEIYRDFSAEWAFNYERTTTDMPLPTTPYTVKYDYILGEKFDQVFIFEPIAVLPKAILDGTAFDLENQVIDASKALRGDKSLLGYFGFFSRGFHNRWFITPTYVGIVSKTFVGWDSGIIAFKIDSKRLDSVLDAALPAYQIVQDPMLKEIFMFSEYAQQKDQFVVGDLGGAIEIFWRLGPPMWMYSIYDMYAGLITFVEVYYDYAINILNDVPIFIGDLESKVLNYSAKVMRRGRDMYIFGLDTTDGLFKIRKGIFGMETVATFERAKYFTGPEIMIAANENDIYLLQALSKEAKTFPMIRYPGLYVKNGVLPAKIVGSNMLLALKVDGDIDNPPEFSLIVYDWLSRDNKTMQNGDISVVTHKPIGAFNSFLIRGYVDQIIGAYQSAFIEMNDVYRKKRLFVDFTGYIEELVDFDIQKTWYVKKAKEFVTFDKFLADSFEYDTINIVEADSGKKLQVLEYLEGEVI